MGHSVRMWWTTILTCIGLDSMHWTGQHALDCTACIGQDGMHWTGQHALDYCISMHLVMVLRGGPYLPCIILRIRLASCRSWEYPTDS